MLRGDTKKTAVELICSKKHANTTEIGSGVCRRDWSGKAIAAEDACHRIQRGVISCVHVHVVDHHAFAAADGQLGDAVVFITLVPG